MAGSASWFLDKPQQPRTLSFPKCSFKKTHTVQVAFKPTWYSCWTWLHYDESSDTIFCLVSMKAEEGKLKVNLKDAAFIHRGFCNWKDVTEGFRHHEASKCHQDAVQVMIVLPKTTHDIGESLSSTHMRKKEESRKVLLKIIQNKVSFEARYCLAWAQQHR